MKEACKDTGEAARRDHPQKTGCTSHPDPVSPCCLIRPVSTIVHSSSSSFSSSSPPSFDFSQRSTPVPQPAFFQLPAFSKLKLEVCVSAHFCFWLASLPQVIRVTTVSEHAETKKGRKQGRKEGGGGKIKSMEIPGRRQWS